MNETVNRILEITFVAVIVYLVLSRATDFNIAITAIGDVYSQAVRTLQAR